MADSKNFFAPSFSVKSVLSLTPAFLAENNIKALILDVDNTLARHDNRQPEIGVREWIDEMKSVGIKMVVASNNKKSRVKLFADSLGLQFMHFSCKPFPFKITKAVEIAGVESKYTAMVGDQLFTDILGGKFAKIRTILVDPFHIETIWYIKLKRKIERKLMGRNFDDKPVE